ncbi:DegV family EDD domain-containing protein [Lysobacter enzymogenes]|nr:DegV family EDD domain-containing protein [Lysobacter enzymogenes]
MAVLQRAGVVDAGAQGFVDLLEGIAEFVDGGPRAAARRRGRGRQRRLRRGPRRRAAGRARRGRSAAALVQRMPVAGREPAARRLRDELEALGADSLVLAGGAARLRVHGHVGSPQSLFDACARFGAVEGMKADDMLAQQRSIEHPQALAVVTDSAADLPEELAEHYRIAVVPVRVSVDGRDYLDKAGLSTAEFYRRMAAGADLPRTSQPPPGDFRRVFDFLAGHRRQVLYVGLSRAVSGTLQAGEQAAARSDAQRVRVFDTSNAAGGLALLAWRAAELAADGIALEAVLAELDGSSR